MTNNNWKMDIIAELMKPCSTKKSVKALVDNMIEPKYKVVIGTMPQEDVNDMLESALLDVVIANMNSDFIRLGNAKMKDYKLWGMCLERDYEQFQKEVSKRHHGYKGYILMTDTNGDEDWFYITNDTNQRYNRNVVGFIAFDEKTDRLEFLSMLDDLWYGNVKVVDVVDKDGNIQDSAVIYESTTLTEKMEIAENIKKRYKIDGSAIMNI